MFDVIIVGAGIEGSAVAYHCAKKRLRTLLLDQFPLPHTRGSSHGFARVTRYAYAEPHYQEMMKEAFPLWALLEKESKTPLYRKTGMLVLSGPEREIYDRRLEETKNAGKPVEEIGHEERQRRYPAFRHKDDTLTFIDVEAGILRANKALQCFQDIFVRHGGVLRDSEKVEHIIPGDTVIVRTALSEYTAKHLILTPGPWAGKLLKPLGLEPPLKTWRINVMFWREKVPGTYSDFPVFVDLSIGKRHIYGLPILEYNGMLKINYHGGIRPVDPDERDTIVGDHQWDIEMVSKYVTEHFPGLHSRPSIVETCMYTTTPDNELILDRHPRHPNIVIGCGFSGHGFKLAPVVGKILCQMVMGETPTHDIAPCSLARFPNSGLISANL
ncbi:peroxisomal sarcosine oxidase-like [Diadema antillarum]|uniref:peroxisomal sarcosine oxidase-like n=1 Tax=Diadema antillarum TaxID=105358 RepID=UPI003A875652